MLIRSLKNIRWIVLASCVLAGLCLGNQSATLLRAVGVVRAGIPLVGTAQAQGVAAAIAAQPNTPQACPAAVINGTIGSGSPDHPFVTGNQTSRLFRDSVESTCGSQKPTPNLTDVGTQFKFDAFSFTNTSVLAICVTVITTAGSANQILTAAYDQSFNPANVQANYLGDAGNSDKTRAFSFIVPGNHSFVVVQSRVNTAANPTSLAYSFRVLGIPTCNSCPPAIISGTIGSGSNQWPASIDTMTGRLFRNATASVCDPAKPVPSVEDDTTQFQYDAYTFLNPSLSAVCVTVNTTAGANNQILTAAYLNRFNPFNVQENYLGDAGNSNQSRSFSFIVPGRRSFVVVQGRVNTAGNPPSLGYFFSVSGLTGCTSCPVIAITPDDVPNGLLGVPYSQQLTRTGGAASGTWSVVGGALPNNMTLNSNTGVLSGTPTSSGNFNFSARFTDSNGCLGEKVYFFSIVTCQTFTLGPDPLPRAAVNTPYSQQLTATGGTPAYTFSVIGGTPPTGITLSASGLLSGTPTTTTPANFTVRATDVNGCTGTKTYTLIVCGVITVNPATAQNGFVGTPYSQTFTQTGGGASPTWSVSAGVLPNGLSLNASSGLLSGTPTTPGTVNFTIRATAFNGCIGERAYTVNISGNGLQFFPLPAPVRLLDTRAGQSACSQPNAPIAGGTSRTQPGRNLCTIPTNAVALTGNITTVNSAGGFLTLFPSNATQPTVANSNYGVNEIINNVFTVGLGADGAFKIFALNTTDVVVDVTGFYAPPTTNGLFFHPLPKPIRLLETRAGQQGCNTPGAPITGGDAGTRTQQARLTCDNVTIPTGALAIVGNATTVNPQGGGFLTLFPANAAKPLVASSNFNPGQIVNGPFTVGLAPTGEFKIFTTATTDLVVDVLGYYSAEVNDVNGAGLLFSPLPKPVRLLETRPGQPVGCFKPGAKLNGQQEFTQPARGVCDGETVPANALGVVGNATVVFPVGQGFLTLWPSTAVRPLVATSNYNTNDVGNRHFIVGLGQGDGAFKIFSHVTTDLVIDVSGFFAP
jgi:hypothetical protein